MARSVDFVALSVLFLMIFSVPAYAIGNAEGGISVDSDMEKAEVEANAEAEVEIGSPEESVRAQMKSRILERRNELKEQYRERNCEEFDEKRERIKCRLVAGDYVAPSGTVPEACRLAENRGRCVALYASVRNCYALEGKTKDLCFKRAIGLRMKLADVDPKEREEKAREYLVTLLYDLEERVEKGVEEGRVDPEDGAEIIDYIVDIKEKILNGASKAEIRVMMQELKVKWRTAVFAEVESE